MNLDTSYEQLFLTIAGWSVFAAIWLYALNIKNTIYQKICSATVALSFFCLTTSLVIRAIGLGHVPIRNLYESLVILAWALLGAYLFLETKYKFRQFGVYVVIIVMGIFLAASWLPAEQREWSPLIPALQSYWRAIHVPPLLVSYSLFLLASVPAVAYLVSYYKNYSMLNLSGGQGSVSAGFDLDKINDLKNKLDFYDELSYRCITFGLPLLTFGIICGGLWANHAWGAIWQWDPKETLALMTWFVYAAYIHLRMRGLSATTTSWIAVVGIIAVYITYNGINQFNLGGLHSYGAVEAQ